jgi:arylsulfatase A-like enzyme
MASRRQEKSDRGVLRHLRPSLIVVALIAGAILLTGAGFSFINHRTIEGSRFAASLDALIERANEVRNAARPEYQNALLASLPPNPTVGPIFRLDDRMVDATVVEEPVRTAEYDRFEVVFAYEFDEEDQLVPGAGTAAPLTQNGRLLVRQTGRRHYLQNGQPIAIAKDEVGEIVVGMRASRGKSIRLAWSPETHPKERWNNKVSTPIIADGKFHTYFINARNIFGRGLDAGDQIRFLAVQPSDTEDDEVEIDFIRFLSKSSRYMRKPRDVVYETVAEEMRRVLYMLPRQVLEYRVQIPDREPRLDFGTAAFGRQSAVTFAVHVVDGKDTTELHQQSIEDSRTWIDWRYDLSRWAGREVALRLTVDGAVGSVGLWSSPIVYGRPLKPFRAVILLEDALRASNLSVHGYDRPTSPFKERLMTEEGIVFLNARSQDNKTRTSVPSMMTSLLPTTTGVWHFADMLSEEFLTLAEVLRSQGFATASFLQNPNAGPYAGLHQGFDVSMPTGGRTEGLLSSEQLSRWLDRHRDQNFLLYLHIADPHGPYDPPAPHDAWYKAIAPGRNSQTFHDALDPQWMKQATREGRIALYDGEIRHNDGILEQFFTRMKAQGLFEDTAFFLVADHGEHFGEHGVWEHGPPGTKQVTGVPLMIVYPQRFPGGQQFRETVQLMDVMPTVLELASVETSGLAMQGDSLVGLVDGRDPEHWRDRVVVSEEVYTRDKVDTSRNRGLRVYGSLFYRNWHFIASRSFWPQRGYVPESLRLRTYGLHEDPEELRPLRRFVPDLYIRYRYTSFLNELQSTDEDAWQRWTNNGQGQTYQFDPDVLEQLKGLGYVQ